MTSDWSSFVIAAIIVPVLAALFNWVRILNSGLPSKYFEVIFERKKFKLLFLTWIVQAVLAVIALIFLMTYKLHLGFFVLASLLSSVVVIVTWILMELSIFLVRQEDISNQKKRKLQELLMVSLNTSKYIVILYIFIFTWKIMLWLTV